MRKESHQPEHYLIGQIHPGTGKPEPVTLHSDQAVLFELPQGISIIFQDIQTEPPAQLRQ